jgi:ABC-type nitrate/sulfonate/bicarbonate transport system substrate-binding protein
VKRRRQPRKHKQATRCRSSSLGAGSNLLIWAAQEQGFFEDESVSVELTNTPGSAFQLQNLIDGNFDIAMTAADNVVAYQEGQGEAEHTEEGSFWLSMR